MLELARWAEMAKAHWREFQPNRYKLLVAAGTLDKEALAAARLTSQEMDVWRAQGATHDEAWQAVREKYLLPPEEPGLEEEELPDNPLHQAIGQNNRDLQDLVNPE